MLEYRIAIERAAGNYSARAPDLTVCLATGASHKETIRKIEKAVAPHIWSIRGDRLTDGAPSQFP